MVARSSRVGDRSGRPVAEFVKAIVTADVTAVATRIRHADSRRVRARSDSAVAPIASRFVSRFARHFA
jgi:hypothetical protein